ncbi:MAG TPA: uL15m family ribosomal protein [Methanoregulaceae archaeon]|nr:MAG: 50S ribosomal protein L15 [Methanolinea sp.]HON81626.1 uL15m family ribosomal protein [Methanoregulaceae archaeon]HPD10433.1 uL15m family ribosomal protein [Methanoregulaceae archaeon]HRT15375.1 uL15m family ribosomal protein [Methanoregulaceae archaeon]HRU31025.1 uL15m family ribosomal protein [Methanoregulaceae archaeon]
MPVNKRSKYRGSRTCGGGTHKNRRGAGNRGGRGRAGHRDHRFSHYLLSGEIHNGKCGFYNQTRRDPSTISIGELDSMALLLLADGKATREGDAIQINADQIGIDKILGSGKVTLKMNVTAKSFSAQAKSKIEEMGGQALVI